MRRDAADLPRRRPSRREPAGERQRRAAGRQRGGRAVGQRRQRRDRRPRRAGRSSRGWTRAITVGSPGHGVSTTPATARPAARAASSVSSVWLIVPRPGRAATTSGKPSATARSRTRAVARQRHEQAADALGDEHVRAGLGRRRARRDDHRVELELDARQLGGEVRRHRRAERAAARPPPGDVPAAAASSSWSRGQPGSAGSSSPVTTGLNAATRSPRARSAATIAPATTVLPTPVSVPVTNSPRISGGAAHAAFGSDSSASPSNTRAGARRRRTPAPPRPGRVGRTGGSRCAARPGRGPARPRAARSCVCDAITASRSRDVPVGHRRRAGSPARTRPARAPPRRSASRAPASPTISGTICVSEPDDVEALARELVAQRGGVVGQPLDAPRLLLRAARAPPAPRPRRRAAGRWRRSASARVLTR